MEVAARGRPAVGWEGAEMDEKKVRALYEEAGDRLFDAEKLLQAAVAEGYVMAESTLIAIGSVQEVVAEDSP